MSERSCRVLSREAGLILLVADVALIGLGCGGGDVTVPPTTGTLEVTTSTSGGEQDPDGYTVKLDAASAQAIGAAATLTTSDVTPGSHNVQLGEVAANCSVSGDNPRTVNVAAGGEGLRLLRLTGAIPIDGGVPIIVDGKVIVPPFGTNQRRFAGVGEDALAWE